jgi:RIO-like serine/threonine protein kinase
MKVDLEKVLRQPGLLLSPGRWNKPQVQQVALGEHQVILKDWRTMARWLRPLARHLARREARIYGLLQHVETIPRVLQTGDRVLVLEQVPGRRISRLRGHRAAAAAALALEAVVARIHAVGVYHFDMRKRDNILVTDEGEVYLIDFTTSIAPRHYGPLGWLLRPVAALVDRYAVLKWKNTLAPEVLSAGERRLLHSLDRLRPWRKNR